MIRHHNYFKANCEILKRFISHNTPIDINKISNFKGFMHTNFIKVLTQKHKYKINENDINTEEVYKELCIYLIGMRQPQHLEYESNKKYDKLYIKVFQNRIAEYKKNDNDDDDDDEEDNKKSNISIIPIT